MKSPLTSAIILILFCIFHSYAEIENVWFRSIPPYSGRLGNFGEAINCISNTLIVTSIAKDTFTKEPSVPMLARYYTAFATDSRLLWSTYTGSYYYEPPMHTLVDNSNTIITPALNKLQRNSLQGNILDDISFHINDSLDFEITAVAQHDDNYFTGGTIGYSAVPPGKRMLCALVKRELLSSQVIASISACGKANCYIGMIAVSNNAIAVSGTFGNPGDKLSIDTITFTAKSWYDRFVLITNYLGQVQSIYLFDDDTYISSIGFDMHGDLYFCGGFNGSLSIGRFEVHSKGGEDAFIVKVSPDQSEYWIKTWGAQSTDDHCSAFSFQNDSLIWVSGSSSESINSLSKTDAASLFIGSLCQKTGLVKDDILIPGNGRADGRGIVYNDNMLYICGYHSGTIAPSDVSFSTSNNQFNMFVASFIIKNSSPVKFSIHKPLVHHQPVNTLRNPTYLSLNGRQIAQPAAFNRNATATSRIIIHGSKIQKLILNNGGKL